MDSVVIDTSAIIAVISNEPGRAGILRVTEGMDMLLAPLSVHWEIGNTFSAMLKHNRITLERALAAVNLYRRIPIRFVEVALEDALRLSDELGIYAYDAYLIQCTREYHAPLLTLDRGLREAASRAGVKVVGVREDKR